MITAVEAKISLFLSLAVLDCGTIPRAKQVALVQVVLTLSKLSLYDKRKLVRIGSKINYTNTANPSKTTTSSNYSQVQEIVGLIDGKDSTLLLL